MNMFNTTNEMAYTHTQDTLQILFILGTLGALATSYLVYGIRRDINTNTSELEDQKAELDDALNNLDDLLLKSANLAEKVEVDHVHSKVSALEDEIEAERTQEGKYQAWKGVVADELDVLIVREKLGTHSSNEAWVNWDGKQNGSVTVRDYYINSCSADWKFIKNTTNFTATLDEVMINGWNSVVRLKVTIKKSLSAIVRGTITYANFDNHGDEMAQKQFMTATVLQNELFNKIQWSRVLVDSNDSSPCIDALF
jgi:hypothetical protein